MCKRAGIAALDGGPKGVTLRFHNDKFASPRVLVDFIGSMAGDAKVKDNKIVVKRDWPTEGERIKGAFGIARDLAERLAEERKAKVKA
jgi:transcription-repair coupling factor (superfamily II helicase)